MVTSLTDAEEPRVNFSITVFESLKYKIRKGHLHINKLPSLLIETVASYSDMHKLLAHISENENPNSDNERIDNILKQLTKIESSDPNKTHFIKNQICILKALPNQLRYSSATLAMAASLQSTSPACYQQLLDSESVTLPSAKHLKKLTSGLNIDTGKLN